MSASVARITARNAPQGKLIRPIVHPSKVGVRLGIDKVPRYLKGTYVSTPLPKGRREPKWLFSSLPKPDIPDPVHISDLQPFTFDEVKRLTTLKEYHNQHGIPYTSDLPEGSLYNPFLSHVTSRGDVIPAIYGDKKQKRLVFEAKRLGEKGILPFGPHTPAGYGNDTVTIEDENGEPVEINWVGRHIPKNVNMSDLRGDEKNEELMRLSSEKVKQEKEREEFEARNWRTEHRRMAPAEVDRAAKVNRVQKRMEDMPRRIEQWRTEKRLEKLAIKPKDLPF